MEAKIFINKINKHQEFTQKELGELVLMKKAIGIEKVKEGEIPFETMELSLNQVRIPTKNVIKYSIFKINSRSFKINWAIGIYPIPHISANQPIEIKEN